MGEQGGDPPREDAGIRLPEHHPGTGQRGQPVKACSRKLQKRLLHGDEMEHGLRCSRVLRGDPHDWEGVGFELAISAQESKPANPHQPTQTQDTHNTGCNNDQERPDQARPRIVAA